jgi:hypothetical protein
MLESVKSISLIIMAQNQSIIHGSMLYYGLVQAHNTGPPHLGGMHHERVNEYFLLLKTARTGLLEDKS